MQEVAERFRVSSGTLRNWVGEFRRYRDAALRPPFSPHRPSAGPHSRSIETNVGSRSPMPKCRRRRRAAD
ncbi:helix-turn-helix domain-containing protein [Singulisphaera rosea]